MKLILCAPKQLGLIVKLMNSKKERFISIIRGKRQASSIPISTKNTLDAIRASGECVWTQYAKNETLFHRE